MATLSQAAATSAHARQAPEPAPTSPTPPTRIGAATNNTNAACTDSARPTTLASGGGHARADTDATSAQPTTEAATSSATDGAALAYAPTAPMAEPRRRGAATTTAASGTATVALAAAFATDASHGGTAGAEHGRKVIVAQFARGLHAPLATLLVGPHLRGDALARRLRARPLCAQLRDAGTSRVCNVCAQAARVTRAACGARAAPATARRWYRDTRRHGKRPATTTASCWHGTRRKPATSASRQHGGAHSSDATSLSSGCN